MILIFSTQEDISTQVAMEWLQHFKVKTVLINELNPITEVTINLNAEDTFKKTLQFSVKSGESISDDEINVVWYRRGLYFFEFPFFKLKAHEKFTDIFEHLNGEYKSLTSFFFKQLDDRTIGEFDMALPNKLEMLV